MSAVEDLLLQATPAPSAESREMPPDGTPTVIGGRYHTLHPETGKKVTFQRASNFAKTLSDDFGLQQWMMRMVLLGAAMRPDLTAQAIAVGAADTRKLNELANAAKEAAGGSKGANLGTAMHSLIERLEEGETIGPLPPEMQRDLDAYRTTLAANGVRMRPELLERIVCCPELGVTGKFDGIAHVDQWDVDAVIDNKTGRHMKWLEWAIQLAVYARSPWMWQPGQGWVPKPVVDLERALVVHLPIGQGTCGLYVLDIAAGWEACNEVTTVKRLRSRKDLAARLEDVDLTGLLESSTSTTRTPATAGDGVDLEALLAAPPAAVALVAPDDAAVDPALENPKFIAERVAYEKDRLAKVLELLGGAQLPVPRPAELPPPGEPYTSWAPVRLLGDWISALEREVRAPFPPEAPEPTDPFASFAADGTGGGTAIVCSGRKNGGCQTVTLPAPTPAEDHDRLKARFAELPVDLQADATLAAKDRGVGDVSRLTKGQLIVLEEVVKEATVRWHRRIEAVAALLEGWADDELALLVTAAAGDRSPAAFTDDDVERLEALLVALGAGTLALVYEPDAGFAITDTAEASVLARFGGSKQAALVVAKGLADRHARSRPKSTADVLADPVLTALVAHPRVAVTGAETPATSNQQGEGT